MKKYDYEINKSPDGNTSDEMSLSYIRPGSVVLEFGSAYGRMTKYLREELDCSVYIAEIDEDGYNRAMEYADGGVCCDISEFSWIEAFEGMSFDYILFVDVLEHLINPREVLCKAVSLLKDKGSLIISIPNIAHSAILLNLLRNKFEYTKLGLLDDTHLRFFTYNSVIELIDYCGFIPIIQNGTTALPQHTEFKVSYDDFNINTSIISNREYAHVYQFVFKCIKKETYYNDKEAYKIENKIPAASSNSCFHIFFNTGKGFNPQEMIEQPVRLEANLFSFILDIEPNIKGIRVDPIEGERCIVNKLKIITNNGTIDYSATNGVASNDAILFDTIDPQIVIDFNSIYTNKVKIEGELYVFGFNEISLFGDLKKMFQSFSTLEEEYKIKNNIIHLLENERASHEESKRALENERKTYENNIEQIKRKTSDKISELNKMLAETDNKLHQARTDIINIEAHALLYKKMYEEIQGSEFWKLTKPMRVFVDCIKFVCRSIPGIRLPYKFLSYVKNRGFREAMSKTKDYFTRKKAMKNIALEVILSKEERKLQENFTFSKNIKFSIITPLYNTPKDFLVEMIESMIAQTYKNWELCLAGGSDRNHDYVARVCKSYAKKDKRVKYKKLTENLGISGNSNKAIEMSSGDFFGLLDHDDLLHPSALYETMKAICEHDADYIYTDEASFEGSINNLVTVHYKPDYAIDNLRACAYVCHFSVFSRKLLEKGGMFRSEFDGSQDHDLYLRLTRISDKVYHIPKLLYFWRCHPGSSSVDISTKLYAIDAGKNAVLSDIKASGMNAAVESAWVCPTFYKIEYELSARPKVSIIIPNKDNKSVLDTCLMSIFDKSTYENYEIIVVENNSTEKETFDYYDEIKSRYDKVKVVNWQEKRFNYSEINNFGIKYATGEHIIFLNNDIEIISPKWIEEMLMYSQRPDVGAVGAKLYYPDDTIQHAGVIMGLGADRLAGHIFHGLPRNDVGYMGRLWISQNMSAVTGACMMVRRDVLEKAGMLSPCFASSFCDIDLCLKIRRAGYLIVWTPYAEAYHYESKTRGLHTTQEKALLFAQEIALFKDIWAKELAAGDPYYNINFSLDSSDYSFK